MRTEQRTRGELLRALAGARRRLMVARRELDRCMQVEEALRISERKLRSLFEFSADGIVLVDEQGIVIEWNRSEAELTGLPTAEAVGRPLWDIMVQLTPEEMMKEPGLQERMRSLISNAQATGQIVTGTWAMERTIRRTDGQHRIVQNLSFPIKTPRGYMIGSITRDITERKQVEAERERLLSLAESRAAELDGAISAVTAGLIIYDAEGAIVRMNDEAKRMLGYGPEEIKRPIRERLAVGIFETVEGTPFPVDQSPPIRALQGETVRGVPMVIRRPQQEPLWVLTSAAPIHTADGRLLGAVLTATDVTALHELQEQTARLLQAEHRAREQTEAAVRARDDFFAAVAHELKTPVTTLRGYMEMTMRRLQREGTSDPEQIWHALRVMDRQTDRLSRLVAQLLDIASLEAERLQIHKVPTDMAALVRETVARAEAGTERRIILQAPHELRLRADAERLERVIANLVENALRYSPREKPVEVTLSQPTPETARLTVRDYGQGIPPERRKGLFSRFYQAQPGLRFAGLGLGLYLGRQIIELHGGRLDVEFPAEGGTCFIVTLPVGPTEAHTKPTGEEAEQPVPA